MSQHEIEAADTNTRKPTTWAVRGKHSDETDDETIAINSSHYEFWSRDLCYENNRPSFNLDFLGKWRYGPLPQHIVDQLVEREGRRSSL